VGATLIDGIILGIPSLIITAVAGRVGGEVVDLAAQLIYETLLIGRRSGRTWGMKAVGTRVVSANDGQPIGYGPAVLRAVVVIVLGVTVVGGLLDILWPLWDPRNQTLHDKAVNSLVVRDH
jgi:uncharacterized RDD family membrane protein YckC